MGVGGTHFIGGWVDPKAGMGRVRKISPHQDWNPDRTDDSESVY